VVQAENKSKNDYCYKNSGFQKRFLVSSEELKMLLREKYQKNKK
jgi:hypothetical protein